MLHVQTYLHNNPLEKLTEELGIKVNRHSEESLVILNYCQINSPKTHPIVRECRGLVLNADTFELVARSFPRFFNWGEVADEMELFDWRKCSITEKYDGSLCLIYYFNGRWRLNTRNSFGDGEINGSSTTWTDLACEALHVGSLSDLDNYLDRELCYVCELCSLNNRVVRHYPEPAMYLLTAYIDENEVPHKTLWNEALSYFFSTPTRYDFKSIDQVHSFLRNKSEDDATYEGVVLCDSKFQRWKVKSPTYLSLHKLWCNGAGLYNPSSLLPFVLSGEESELLVYFPEARDNFEQVKQKVNAAYEDMMQLWNATRTIENQKEFAMAIVGKTPFTGILFDARKRNVEPAEIWRSSEQLIYKKLFD